MSIIVYNKLVRDRIPHIITADGHIPSTRILDPAEHRGALFAKLEEEAAELSGATEADRLGELADLQEVLNALAKSYGYTPAEVAFKAGVKRGLRGGFDGGIYLEHTTAR